MSLSSPCRGTSSAQRERSRGWRTTRCWSCCMRRPSTTCSHPATPVRSQTTSCWAESRLITKTNWMEMISMKLRCLGSAGDWTVRHGSSYTGILSTESCKFFSHHISIKEHSYMYVSICICKYIVSLSICMCVFQLSVAFPAGARSSQDRQHFVLASLVCQCQNQPWGKHHLFSNRITVPYYFLLFH